jgi:hypothetical protein
MPTISRTTGCSWLVGVWSRLESFPRGHWLATPDVPAPFGTAAPSTELPASRAVDGLAYIDTVLANAGFDEWAYVWFHAYDGIACCRVLVPGVETWHPTAGHSEIGMAVARRLGRKA